MLRSPAKPLGRRFGLAELMIALLVLSLVFALVALKGLEDERDEWRDRLFITLKSSSEAARASDQRLRQTIDMLDKQDEEDKRWFKLPAKFHASSAQIAKNDYFPIKGKTSIIIFCYNRAHYLKRTFESVISRLDSASPFVNSGLRIIVSQDGYDGPVREAAEEFVKKLKEKNFVAEHIQHIHIDAHDKGHMAAYYALSAHYGKGLDYAFSDRSSRVIVLEDDLELAVDFFPYFQAFAKLLEEDTSLLAVSAWNDHGQEGHISDPSRVYRTDVFPGLGWMLTERTWKELKPKWPAAFWDDWLRAPEQRQGRQFIRPEITRTITFGESGASQGQFFQSYLRTMRLNDKDIRFSVDQVSALRKDTFDSWFIEKVNKAKQANNVGEIEANSNLEFKLMYNTLDDFKALTHSLQVMDDIKYGSPRGSYRGILPIRYRGSQLYIVPTVISPIA